MFASPLNKENDFTFKIFLTKTTLLTPLPKVRLNMNVSEAFFSNILPNGCHLMVCYGPRALCNVNVSLQALKGNIDENLTNSSAI